MPNMPQNLGLDFLWKDDKTINGFIGYLAQEGKVLPSYSGAPYIFTSTGASEFWLRTALKEENGENVLQVVGIDSHCGGNCIWKMAATDMKIGSEEEPMSELMMFKDYETGSGMVPIHIINPDVLPGILEDDAVTVQVIALPLGISYYADDEEYAASLPKDDEGEKWSVAPGSLFPYGFFLNHAVDRPENERDDSLDGLVLFSGKVTKLLWGTFKIGDQEDRTFIRCFIDSQFGPLEFDHIPEQVPEELRRNIKVGSIVSGKCLLSGDVALYEYENGIVKDHENDLKAFRYTCEKGKAERLYPILATDADYHTDSSGETFTGARNIVERINYVHQAMQEKCKAHPATIISVDGDGQLPYPVGTRCLVLEYGETNVFDSIVFIDCNETGEITHIEVSTESRYHFKIDDKPVYKNPLADFKIPDSVVEPIVTRAKFMHLIDRDTSPEDVIAHMQDYTAFKSNAEQMLEALEKDPQPDIEVALENIFGYLFAKAIEQETNERTAITDKVFRLTARYSPSDAFAGILNSTFSEEEHEKLRRKMEKGKHFFTDYKVYTEGKHLTEDDFHETVTTALIAVQRIGQMHTIRNAQQ